DSDGDYHDLDISTTAKRQPCLTGCDGVHSHLATRRPTSKPTSNEMETDEIARKRRWIGWIGCLANSASSRTEHCGMGNRTGLQKARNQTYGLYSIRANQPLKPKWHHRSQGIAVNHG